MNTVITAPAVAPEIATLALSEADLAHLIDNQGVFMDGYDSDDINRILGQFETARLVCVWGVHDDMGYGGDSEFFGVAKVTDPEWTHMYPNATKDAGPWRQINGDVWSYLSDPDSEVDPSTIACLLAPTSEDAPQNINDMAGDGFANVAVETITDDEDDEETCIADDCDESLDDNEGFDGYCGTHADKIEGHNQGSHRALGKTDDEGDETTGPDEECPNCQGAGVVWG